MRALPDDLRSSEGEPIAVKALRDLGVPALRGAIKEMGEAGASTLGPIRIAECGVEVDVDLSSGSPRTRYRSGAASWRRT
ncbi:hypothetical protein GCM10010121_032420 [Streptomyces brasiliensis]|uniref:Uncharacterized protein n=1 Tax=Streptomyces brasiliensis TaxID=1954 RepID=A0A917KL86_9ACTN|nr:hypothetical protein GCM10010121_032420 [Streptomyces brasiliensis]